MTIAFSAEVWFWKGPAPWYFVTVSEVGSLELKAIAPMVTYGWGMIPVVAKIGSTEYSTSLWPKDGSYILPIKAAIRKVEKLEVGQRVHVELTPVSGKLLGQL
jgi:hypothetical protein